jgi:2-oxoglutarate ferredoxin oxidoreductase subunit beta
MVDIEDYGQFETAWCPGCGNFGIRKAVVRALAEMDLAPHQVLFVSGIGQAAKAPHYIKCNFFNGLHGRAVPTATGARLANPDLPVIVESGDGCNYGEGGNHFMAGMRRNVNLTLLAHDNQVYGLTKGQASPTTTPGMTTKAQPYGVFNAEFKPISVAVAHRAGFVARSFSGNEDHLTAMIKQAVRFEGFALVDILQPCVSFNHINTYKWYQDRCYELDENYDPTDWTAAMRKSFEWGDRIPIGVIYRNDEAVPLEHRLPGLRPGPLTARKVDDEAISDIMASFL